MHAVRNIDRCTKDCLCLYVCPTGASDTENGQIDASKCIGCGACANACPSHAIVLVPEIFPRQQEKTEQIVSRMMSLADSKTKQEKLAEGIVVEASQAGKSVEKQFAQAVARSNRIMAEDIMREAGYLLPQSDQSRDFLKGLSADAPEDFPRETLEELMKLLKF